jgi:Bacterial Ig-like domain (group 3)
MSRFSRTRVAGIPALVLLLISFSGGSVLGAAPAGATRGPLTFGICADLSPAQCGELNTTTDVSSSVNFSRYGQEVTFTATVTSELQPPRPALPVAPTGTVDFKDGGTTLCGAVMLDSNGQATCTKHTLVAGTHTITAFYHPTPEPLIYNESSGTLVQTVKRAGTHSIIGSSDDFSSKRQPVTFSALVYTPPPGGGIPTGRFQFTIDGVLFGDPVPVGANGRAFLPPIDDLTIGGHLIGGKYLGDPNHRTSKPVRLYQLVALH